MAQVTAGKNRGNFTDSREWRRASPISSMASAARQVKTIVPPQGDPDKWFDAPEGGDDAGGIVRVTLAAVDGGSWRPAERSRGRKFPQETEKPSGWMAFLCDGQSLASLKLPLPRTWFGTLSIPAGSVLKGAALCGRNLLRLLVITSLATCTSAIGGPFGSCSEISCLGANGRFHFFRFP